jgi:shikimate 5-dehydrogenase
MSWRRTAGWSAPSTRPDAVGCDLFDGRGCVAAARASGHALEWRAVLQVGAGGVGRAIAFAFAEASIARLCA